MTHSISHIISCGAGRLLCAGAAGPADTSEEGWRVLAYIHDGVDATAVPIPDSKEADILWVSVLSQRGSHLIACIYRPAPGRVIAEAYISATSSDIISAAGLCECVTAG